MYKHSTVVNNTLYVDGIDRLDLSRSCACGQSFRWHEDNGGFTAPALGRVVHARQAGGHAEHISLRGRGSSGLDTLF